MFIVPVSALVNRTYIVNRLSICDVDEIMHLLTYILNTDLHNITARCRYSSIVVRYLSVISNS